MQKDLNLFAVGRGGAGGDRNERTVLLGGLAVLALLVLVFAGVTVGVRVLSSMTRTQTEQIETYLSGSQVAAARTTLQQSQNVIASLNNYAAAATKAVDELEALPLLDSGVIGQIQAAMPAGVKAITFSYQDGVITLNCTGTDQLAPAHFAENLINNTLFTNVNYAGYTNASGSVAFSVTFSLKGGR